MKVVLEVNNLAKKCCLSKNFLQKIVLCALNLSGIKDLKKKKVIVSLAFVSPKKMKQLNLCYRKKDKITDVLSFAEYKSAADLEKEKKNDIFIGEIIVCPEFARRMARREKIPGRAYLSEIVAHGVLHLIGFRHSRKMFELQKNILECLGICKS